MNILFSPIVMHSDFSVDKSGDRLVVNGKEFDFSRLEEGDRLDGFGIDPGVFVHDVYREHGEINLTLLLPIPDQADEDQSFPVPIVNVPDGVVATPVEKDRRQVQSFTPFSIDWTKLVKAEDARNEALVSAENGWRAEQMPIAQQNVVALQFGEAGMVGTEQQWKAYWLALRKWTAENPDFPDRSKRPVAPS